MHTLPRKSLICVGELFFYLCNCDEKYAYQVLYYLWIKKGGDHMHFTSFLENGRLTVALTGEIDHHCAKNYIQAISGKIEAYTPDVCILDFQDVSFVDSSGIAVVINALRSMTQIEGKLELTGICQQPMRVFRASGIDKLVDIKEAVS